MQCLTARQRHADLPVARQVPGGGENQIAQATQAHKGLGTRTERHTQARHFCQPARDQGGASVEAQIQTVAQAGGDRQHVLDGAANFHTHDVVIGINAQGRAVQGRNQRLAYRCMGTGSHQRRRLATRHFLRETRSAENTGHQMGRCLRLYFMRQHATFAGTICGKALAEPGHRHATRRQFGQQATQGGHWRGDDDQIGCAQQRA